MSLELMLAEIVKAIHYCSVPWPFTGLVLYELLQELPGVLVQECHHNDEGVQAGGFWQRR